MTLSFNFKTNVINIVRSNRKDMPKDLCKVKLKRGEYGMRSCNWILAIKWKDKRDDYTLTTKHETVEMTTQGSNRSQKPNCITEHKGMIGIDHQGQILACFPVMRKYMKGYQKFVYLFNIGIFNSYILCNKINNGKNNVTLIIGSTYPNHYWRICQNQLMENEDNYYIFRGYVRETAREALGSFSKTNWPNSIKIKTIKIKTIKTL